MKQVLMIQNAVESGGVEKSEKKTQEETANVKKLLVGRIASLSRKQEGSETVEDIGSKILLETFPKDTTEM